MGIWQCLLVKNLKNLQKKKSTSSINCNEKKKKKKKKKMWDKVKWRIIIRIIVLRGRFHVFMDKHLSPASNFSSSIVILNSSLNYNLPQIWSHGTSYFNHSCLISLFTWPKQYNLPVPINSIILPIPSLPLNSSLIGLSL